MAAAGGAEGEDPFAEFIAQEQPEQADPNAQLAELVACSKRQEQLLGKVCSLLVSLDEKMGRMVSAQEGVEAAMQRMADQGGVAGGGAAASHPGGGPLAAGKPVQRGSIVKPPGARDMPAGGAAPAAAPAARSAEAQQAAAEKLAADKLRIEEEARRRAEELARKRAEDEQRKREEMERQRVEEERRREEERQRKEALEKKTNGLMSNLIAGSGGGLFGDDDLGSKKKTKGGLFDD